MAFVFRSEKKSTFEENSAENVREEEPVEKESQPRAQQRVWKGMPYIPSINKNMENGF